MTKGLHRHIKKCFQTKGFKDIIVFVNPTEGSWNNSFIVSTNQDKFCVKINYQNRKISQ